MLPSPHVDFAPQGQPVNILRPVLRSPAGKSLPAILIYDGECGFCRWSLSQLARVMPSRPDFRAWQSIDLDQYGLSPQQTSVEAWWVDSTGAYGGHRAFGRWLAACGRPWSWLGSAMTCPPLSALTALGYRVIARHRHRIPGPWARKCTVLPQSHSAPGGSKPQAGKPAMGGRPEALL
ncbi:thiol-disulfide oxidoreductase DCC family protein [Kitasatospora saccharophila]|uniref:thiol-disulfide oxidoreductase DCC family protein n=1 Tax=Kitasatospora saccharophila TaxID=407973 RepID=UPI003CD08769